MPHAAESFDVTARKAHQAACVGLLALAFILGQDLGRWLVALVGLVLLLGRYWWPADLFRQLVWRVLEPAGLLTRREREEDHTTRRTARILGGAILVAASAVLSVGAGWAWPLVAAIGLMIFLDAAVDFCALCALHYWLGRLRSRDATEAPHA